MPVALREFTGWSWTFHGDALSALTNISFRIEAGERVLIVGPSGGGKSTLLRAIAGLLSEDTGSSSGELISAAVRVGYVGQEPDEQMLFPTVGEDVAFVAETTVDSASEVKGAVRHALDTVRALPLIDRATTALSGGEKQRVGVAACVAAQADLVICDEPTASLDPANAVQVRDAICAAVGKRVASLVVVEHRIELWRDHVDRVVVVADGAIVSDLPIAQHLAAVRAGKGALSLWTAAPSSNRQRPEPELSGQPVIQSRGLVTERATDAPTVAVPDLTVYPGRCVALIGPNGSGKTATLRALAGLRAPREGDIAYSGFTRQPHRITARRRAQFAASVMQNPSYSFLHSTVAYEAPAHVLGALGLSRLDSRNPHSLSGGERRRLGMAIALGGKPAVVFLDEPTFGQDPQSWRDVVSVLDDYLSSGGAVVMATHDHELVRALADDVIELGGDA